MQQQVAQRLHSDVSVFWRAETGSTNDDAKEAARNGQRAVAVFGAERQTHGRGRLERCWCSGVGQAVEMSFLFRPSVPGRMLAGFNFAAALGICDGVDACCGLRAQVKWPNDVLVDGAKLCGILSEACFMGPEAAFVVTGTGINVNQCSFPAQLGGAVSLRMLTGRPLARAVVASACIDGVVSRTEAFARSGFAGIMDDYRRRSVVLGRDVEVIGVQGTVRGRCVDFGEDGSIVIATGSGRQHFHASEVSLRGAGLHV